ncbi:hypothetical protein JCM8547_001711 [Rhodosporidiobolus lusitaniae]
MSALADKAERPAKRPRTSTACDACRKRRAKCDGEKPKCGRCSTLKLDCLYDFSQDQRKPVTQSIVKALELRVASLEQELAAVKGAEPLKVQGERQSDADAQFSGTLAVNSHGELRFAGATSTFRAIVGSVESAVEAARAWSLTRAPIPNAPPLDPFLPKPPPQLNPQLSGKLIRYAFEYCFSQFGLVEERAFLADLAKNPTARTPNYSPLLLHLVLAIGSRYLDPSDPDFNVDLCSDIADPSTRGDVFVNWARLMLDQEWYHPDLSTARVLTLLSTYLAGQALDGPALMFDSQNMRINEDFGLHLDLHRLPKGAQNFSKALRDSRRTAFWSSFGNSVWLCTHLGRKPLLTFADIDTTLPPVEQDIEYDEPAYRSSSFHAASKLVLIQSRMLDSVYSFKIGTTLAARQAAVPELHLALESWYHELPSPLRASTPTPSKAPHPHIVGLNALYHATVIQLHRPFFRRPEDGVEMGVSTDKCLSSAKNTVRLTRLQRETHGLRFVHPAFQYCLFTAGTILALSATEENIFGVPSRDAERKSQADNELKSIIRDLRECGKTWKTALTSADVLETLSHSWASSQPASTSALPELPRFVPQPLDIPQAPTFPPLAAPTGSTAPPPGLPVPPATPLELEPSLELFSGFHAEVPAFPAIFPSWDLDTGGSSLDDFLTLLHPAPENGEGEVDFGHTAEASGTFAVEN